MSTTVPNEILDRFAIMAAEGFSSPRTFSTWAAVMPPISRYLGLLGAATSSGLDTASTRIRRSTSAGNPCRPLFR